ncbi:ATP-binding protein [Mesorhizobium sp. M7A.F.Ca.US.001.04.1.1]|uniref:ATP-binding protein n=1 Tax=unclassified Mesorhizobium TaxID=325217 RepID=UPI000FCC63FF|nr:MULTISPECIES: ATP-binding protein [unclassified Mesorhizobium]RUY22842.1 ATP-binding protein [Mesorhizobium sp. M7A.F.Ca.US.001.04.2.1]RUY34720.1 ATP-binding protein [Mesorhizobium sp. M7A.F.Ca.US.001.04.1.1]
MATYALIGECTLELPDGWVDAWKFEKALIKCGDALGSMYNTIVIIIPAGCKLMIDVIIRLLSFCNQAVASTKRVQLEFGNSENAMGYLNRIGFFDHLSTDVEVSPLRPFYSRAAIHRGGNGGLVEIERFSRSNSVDQNLVPRLVTAVERGCAARADVKQIGDAMFSIFGELVKNVFDHSQTSLDAYAALQTYPQGNRLTVAVSDSGIGIMRSLRPALRGGPWDSLSDVDLVVEIFREGISSKPKDERGLGLKSSAKHAIGFGADLDVRLLNQRVLLKPSNNEYQPNIAYSQGKLPLLWGTHIAFSFKLG